MGRCRTYAGKIRQQEKFYQSWPPHWRQTHVLPEAHIQAAANVANMIGATLLCGGVPFEACGTSLHICGCKTRHHCVSVAVMCKRMCTHLTRDAPSCRVNGHTFLSSPSITSLYERENVFFMRRVFGTGQYILLTFFARSCKVRFKWSCLSRELWLGTKRCRVHIMSTRHIQVHSGTPNSGCHSVPRFSVCLRLRTPCRWTSPSRYRFS